MIIIVNSFPSERAHAVAKVLAARSDGAVPLTPEVECPDQSSARPPRAQLTEFLEASERALLDARRAGDQLCTLGAAFFRGETLRALRRHLDRHDDVIYAYRVDATPSVGDATAEVVAWRAAQERGARLHDMGYEIQERELEPAAAAIWDDVHQPVDLVEPDPGWVDDFARERAEITAALGALASSVEHVGSTAVPGLIAKPIIDILVTVPALERAAHLVAPLRALGYAFIDYPQNRARRFFCKGAPRSHHIHVVEQGGAEHLDKLAFRDALRADQELRAEYRQLKLAAASALRTERAAYGERKSELVRRVLARCAASAR